MGGKTKQVTTYKFHTNKLQVPAKRLVVVLASTHSCSY